MLQWFLWLVRQGRVLAVTGLYFAIDSQVLSVLELCSTVMTTGHLTYSYTGIIARKFNRLSSGILNFLPKLYIELYWYNSLYSIIFYYNIFSLQITPISLYYFEIIFCMYNIHSVSLLLVNLLVNKNSITLWSATIVIYLLKIYSLKFVKAKLI